VSETVKGRRGVAGSGITFEERGEHDLEGVPDRWRPFAVVDEARRVVGLTAPASRRRHLGVLIAIGSARKRRS
jgi:hypothetical protein